MNLSLVVAASTNNVIGKENQLPWHLPNDLRFFKNTTWAMPVLMGRNTFESMKSKPLNGRVNMVMTGQKDWKADGVITVHSMKDAILFAHENDYKEIMVIGGAKIFSQTIGSAQNLYLTRVHTTIDGDVFFPELDEKEWALCTNEDHPADEKHAYAYSFQHWKKKA